MNAITLTNPTDDELSDAVAEHVAGHKNTKQTHWACKFYFATSANAVLPLLQKCRHWKAQQWEPSVVWVDLDAPNYGDGVAETFPRAACIALLRANGVEVIT